MAFDFSLSSHLKAFGVGIVLAIVGIAAYVQFGTSSGPDASELPTMTVYKSPTCQCCDEWVDYMREEGFDVETSDRDDMEEIKEQYGISRELASCHTGVIGDYVVEGHVPADDIRRLFAEEPSVVGLTVPGMPVGSPGMERGNQKDPYNVLTFTEEGDANVFARYHQ